MNDGFVPVLHEIGADGDTPGAAQLGDVADVAQHVVERRLVVLREQGLEGVEADHAARGDAPDLVVGEASLKRVA